MTQLWTHSLYRVLLKWWNSPTVHTVYSLSTQYLHTIYTLSMYYLLTETVDPAEQQHLLPDLALVHAGQGAEAGHRLVAPACNE